MCIRDRVETYLFNGSVMNASKLDAINTSMTGVLDVDTINASTINGDNLSTASILFNSDFQFSLNTLSLSPNQTSAAIQTATLNSIATQVDSATGNFSTILSDFATIGGTLNMNSGNVSTLNYSSAVGINLSATNISATSITAPDVQPTLTAGTNITITGTTISATGGSSFDPTNISNTNLSSVNITTTNLTATLLNNHQNFMRYYTSGGNTLSSSQTSYDVRFTGTSSGGQKENTALIVSSSNDSIFTIAVPTTAGTGAESTKFATIWSEETKQKFSYEHENLLPEVVYLLPEFTKSLNHELTLTTMLDALCHSVDSLLNKYSNDISIELSKKAI